VPAATQRYLIDSSVLIQAHKAYYRFKFCPGFWDSVIWHCNHGAIRSIDKVHSELQVGRDALTHWASKICPKKLFESTQGAPIGTAYGGLIAWAHGKNQYTVAALSNFSTVADAWLVAHAQVNSYVVVTQEEPAPQSQASIKIPDVCDAHRVKWMGTYQMLENLGISLSWKPST
jgi:uncharacterized protein DUF4411